MHPADTDTYCRAALAVYWACGLASVTGVGLLELSGVRLPRWLQSLARPGRAFGAADGFLRVPKRFARRLPACILPHHSPSPHTQDGLSISMWSARSQTQRSSSGPHQPPATSHAPCMALPFFSCRSFIFDPFCFFVLAAQRKKLPE
jgi:hypothetical protein